MTNKTNKVLIIVLGAIILVGATAAATAYISDKQVTKTEQVPAPRVVHERAAPPRQQQAQAVQQQPKCNDENIVGTVAGAALGGIAGNQLGKGNGKTVATVGGALGGAYLGNQYIPTNGVACK